MSRLKLTLLGSPTLERDGRPLAVSRRKAKALLAYLAVTRQNHGRETLVAIFWPDYDESHGRADLSRTLSQLRRIVGAGSFLTDRESVALHPEAPIWVDVLHFRRQLDACRRMPAMGDEQLEALSAAVALYQGDFMAGFTLPDSPVFDEWQLLQTEALRRDLAWALARLAEAQAARHDLDGAIASARRRVALDPLHEAAQRQLIELYARSGQYAEAHRQYESCVQLLAEELGVEPQPETTRLYEQVRRHRLADPPPPSRPRLPAFLADVTVGPSPREHFIGRAAQLSRLDEQLAAAQSGSGGLFFITGGAGRGKTALLSEFVRRAHEAYPDLLAAGGSCSAYGGWGDPYLPFREILEMLAGNIEAHWRAGTVTAGHARRLWEHAPATAAALLEHGPQLAGIFVDGKGLLSRLAAAAPQERALLAQLGELAESAPPAAGLEQSGLFGQYTNLLHHLARRHPLLLTIDDLQWADQASISLLFHLGRRLAGSRILIIGAYRPDEVTAGQGSGRLHLAGLLEEFRRTYGDVWIDLAAADKVEGQAFVEALLDSEPNLLDDAFRRALFAQTGGQPLFTIELLRQLRADGALVQNEAGQWCQSRALDWTLMPARVEAVIARRLERLEAGLRQSLDIASVEGESFTAEVVARVQGSLEEALLQQLSQLEKQYRLVHRSGDSQAGGRYLSHYRFSHALYQQYLYGQLSPGQQRRLHGAVAEALSGLYAGSPDEVAVRLAHHYRAAGQLEAAAGFLAKAGDLSRRRASLADAAGYYQEALAFWPQSDPSGRAGILRLLGECLWMLGRHQEALVALEAGYELFRQLKAVQGMGAMQRLRGRVYDEMGEPGRALAHYRQALSILEQEPESAELAWALESLADYYMKANRYEEATEYGRQALAMARRVGDEALIIRCLLNLGSTVSGAGDWSGLVLEEESLERALAANRPHDACRAYAYLAEGLLYLGRYREAGERLDAGIAYGRRMHIPYFTQAATVMRLELDWLTGHWRQTLDGRPPLLAWIESGQTAGRVELEIRRLLARLYNDLGQAEAASDVLAPGLAVVRSVELLDTTIPYLAELARAGAALGRQEAAAAAVEELLGWLQQAAYLYPTMGPALLYVCRWAAGAEKAAFLERAESALAQLERLEAQYRTPATAACFLEGQGWLRLAAGQGVFGVRSFQLAVERWRELGHPYDQARALAGLAQMWEKAGEPEQVEAARAEAGALIASLAAQLETAEPEDALLASSLLHRFQSSRFA